MYNLSSAEGARFAEIVTEMNERITRLGPSPLQLDPKHVEQGVREITAEAEEALQGEKNDCCRS